jgi:hypothetical protein
LAAGAVAVALFVVQGAQGLIGAFNPRWEAQVLLTAGIVCLTLLTQRLARLHRAATEKKKRAELLEASMREWPVPTASEADPQALGVFPAARDIDADAYVDREIDSDLTAAISASSPLLLVGAPLAGKSRTALRAVRQALGDARVVAPRNAHALRQLLNLDPELAFDMTERVLWLDGLSRYMKALDARVLDRLADAGLPIVATAREKSWKRMLASEDHDGEAAKALAARARTFELPLTPSQNEQNRAIHLLGDRDYSRGLGPALSSNKLEARAPGERGTVRAADAPSRDVPRRGAGLASKLRALRLVDPLVVGLFAGTLLCFGWVGYYVITDTFEKPSIADQVVKARQAGAQGNRKTIAQERGDFRSSGEQSYVFAFGDDDETLPSEARSDEIQVWDVDGEELNRAFAFEPRLLGDEQTVFQFRGVGDIDGDGADELVGGYGTEAIRGEMLIPFALDWDSDKREYQLVSLNTEPPAFATRARDKDARGLRDTYRKRLVLTNRGGEDKPPLKLAGYPAQDFIVTESDQLLISAYVTHLRPKLRRRLVELQPQLFHRTGGPPKISSCGLEGTDTLTGALPIAQVYLLFSALEDFWRQASEGRYCAPNG